MAGSEKEAREEEGRLEGRRKAGRVGKQEFQEEEEEGRQTGGGQQASRARLPRPLLPDVPGQPRFPRAAVPIPAGLRRCLPDPALRAGVARRCPGNACPPREQRLPLAANPGRAGGAPRGPARVTMSRGGSRWPVRLLVLTCLMAGPALSQECSAEKMENSIIDIDLSLPRGVRGAEPLRVPSAGACVRACCSGPRLAGDKKCNLVIFYAARTSTHPNCYLFYCPSTEACPMKPATGLVSYKITTDIHALEDKSIKTENFSSNEYSLPSDAGTFLSHSQDIHQNHTASLEQSVFHQASELLNHIGKHLDNMELHTVSPESQRAKESESLDPISRQQVINGPPSKPSAAPVGNPTASFPTTARAGAPETSRASLAPLPTGTAQLESLRPSLHPGAAKPTTAASPPAAAPAAKTAVPATSIAVTQVPLPKPTNSASPSTTVPVTTTSGSAATLSGLTTPAMAPQPTVVSSSDTSHVTLLSLPGFILSSDSPASSQNDLQGYDPSDSEGSLLEGVLRGKGLFQLGEKSSLVAALFFGVIFLLLVIVLTGKKIHESLQKRHYTRLDYLINGMYADV